MNRTCRKPVSLAAITLVELMVMSVIASLVALTVIQGFSGISKGIIAGRFKSLATQLANEMMQSTKSTPYYQLRVSSQTIAPTGLSSLDPPVLSDQTNYPPVDHVINGVHFTRYMYVQRMQKNASENLEVIGWNAPDSGLKQITLSVLWREREEWKQVLMVNLLENPNRMASNGDFVGYVKDVPLNNIPDVLVEVAENTSLNTLTDASGNYRLGVPVGTYTLRASKRGYFPITTPNRVVTSTTPQVTVNFTNLTAMSSGTVSGTVWHNDHLVISRVCGAKMDGGTSQEYVEIFNPTTWTWTLDGQIGLLFRERPLKTPCQFPLPNGLHRRRECHCTGEIFPLFQVNNSSRLDSIDGVFVGPDAGWADERWREHAIWPTWSTTIPLNILMRLTD
jgi:type II secretory pathway pseudopilin PulG